MSAGMRSVHGVTHYEPDRAAGGYTLFAPMYGRNVWLIDMWGTIVHRWQVENLPGNYGQLLPNGHLLYAGRTLPPAIPEFDVLGVGFGPQLPAAGWATGLGLMASAVAAWTLLAYSIRRWRRPDDGPAPKGSAGPRSAGDAADHAA